MPETKTRPLTDSRLANLGAVAIFNALDRYCQAYAAITERAAVRFAQRDWQGRHADARERLQIYSEVVTAATSDVCTLLGVRLTDKLVWASMKAVFSGLIMGREDWDIAETFFNSVTRRIFVTVGVDPQIEFVATDFDAPPLPAGCVVYTRHRPLPALPALVGELIAPARFAAPFAALEDDCRLVAERIAAAVAGSGGTLAYVDMIGEPFFRGTGAYLIGRIATTTATLPLALALRHDRDGIRVDAVLLDENSVSILFSFTRAYFHVRTSRPYDLVQFLRTLLPQKRVAELYIAIGYHKHGKTELYRDLLEHLAQSPQKFTIAPGQRGMVMIVFQVPDYDVVFKLIKDRFSYPKKTTRRDVLEKYELVFNHDRAGRLIDAQVFEHLRFARSRFDDQLLAELLAVAGSTVQANEHSVDVRHCYVARRVTPLDLFLQTQPPELVAAAVADFGQAIKDLATNDIFPGDMLLKNFGVTRHGRVVFYDYDELRPLTGCRFRRFPQAASYDDELAAEPWYHVGEDDFFPEEFDRFMGLPPAARRVLGETHGDLFDVAFWQETQAALAGGRELPLYPYRSEQRLRPELP